MELKQLPHFFNNKVYTIPDYQRGYSWAQKHVNDLLADISNAILLDKPHYVGTISLHPQKDKVKVGVNNFINYHVVDGQQRFTTLILIISYILSQLSNREETKEDAEEKLRSYLRNRDSYIFRYEIDKVSDDYFRSVILELERKTTLDENLYTRNLLNAKTTVRDFFKNNNSTKTLLTYLNAIEEKLVFNEFLLSDGTEIGVVFETMNNRGIDLTNLEIVKNRLLYLISKVPNTDDTESELLELSALINKKWSHILKNLTLPNKVLDENTFLSNHWIIYKGWTKDNTTKKDILERHFTITEMIKQPDKMAKEIRKYITSLSESSLAWRHLNYPEEIGAFTQIKDIDIRNDISYTLSKLNRLSNSTVRPLILAFYPLLEHNPDYVLQLIQLAEIFSFRLFSMNKKRSDTGKNDIYRQCHNFHVNATDEKYQKYALFFLAWYIEIHGDWKRFELEKDDLFNSHRKLGFYSWSGLSYFLYEYEESLRKGQSLKVEYNFANQTAKSIEHILPQTPTKPYWVNVLKGLSSAEKKQLTHCLGNLLLISSEKNNQLKNNEYLLKKEHYKVGSYSENNLAKHNADWGKEEINKRNVTLLKFIKKRWRFEDNFWKLYPNPFNEDGITDETEDLEILAEDGLID